MLNDTAEDVCEGAIENSKEILTDYTEEVMDMLNESTQDA